MIYGFRDTESVRIRCPLYLIQTPIFPNVSMYPN